MTYRQRMHQLDQVEEFLEDLKKSEKIHVPYQIMEELRSMLAREQEWVKVARPRACLLQEGGIYNLPLRYVGGMHNLQFEQPDGNRFLIPPGLEKHLEVVSLPPPVEKQQEMAI